MVQEIISFDLCGKVAHFRKFYSSSTALSYTIPPKTTITGLISAILGLKRDTYYDDYDNWFIGIQIISPIKKVFQKFNYLNVKSIEFNTDNEYSNVNGFDNRTQISVEVLIPKNIREEVLKYRIYIGVVDREDDYFQKLKKCLVNNKGVFGVALGGANMLGYYENYIDKYKFSQINPKEIVLKSSAFADNVELINGNNEMIVEQDIFPLKMTIQNKTKSKGIATRIATDTKSLIYPINESGMYVKIINHINFYQVTNKNETTNIALI